MIKNDETTTALSIGMIIGGNTAANRPWVEALEKLTGDVMAARAGVESEINVNFEFHVPGNFLVPEFEGVRTGAFRKADSLLKVQVALPPDPAA